MKQKFKRLFIVFGVFLVFTLLFTIRIPTHAYTADDMPEGYRLLSAADVGKSFGVDLESVVYFDTSALLPNPYYSQVIYFTNFISFNYSNEESWYINGTTFNITQMFIIESYTFTDNLEITSYNSGYGVWNNFFYVKDLSTTCYTEEDLENARTEGYNEGYTVGSTEGYNEGYTNGVNSVNTQDYYNSGYTAGSIDGYNEGYAVGYQHGVDSIDTQDYYNQGYTAASDDFLVFENLIFGTMNGFTRTIQSLFDFQIFGISVFGLVGGLVGIAFGIGLIILIIKVVKIFT